MFLPACRKHFSVNQTVKTVNVFRVSTICVAIDWPSPARCVRQLVAQSVDRYAVADADVFSFALSYGVWYDCGCARRLWCHCQHKSLAVKLVTYINTSHYTHCRLWRTWLDGAAPTMWVGVSLITSAWDTWLATYSTSGCSSSSNTHFRSHSHMSTPWRHS